MKKYLFSLFLFISFSLLLTAQCTLDQSQQLSDAGRSARNLPGYYEGQSFTVGFSGLLCGIDLKMFNTMSGVGILNIYSGTGITGTLLISQNVSVLVPTMTSVWQNWTINTPLPVTAGQVYTFQFVPVQGGGLPDPYGVNVKTANPYGAGQDLGDPSFDLTFRTHVISCSPLANTGPVAGSATQCPAVTGQLYSVASVSGATSYSWTVPTGWAITGGAGTNSITVTSGNTGQNGNISVTASNSCGTGQATSLAVNVLDGTPATPGPISGTATQCPALASQNYSITAVAGATSYTWTVPTGWTITGGTGTNSITVTTGSTGQNGNITVAASNSCGTSSAATLAVTVANGTPASPGTISGSANQCPFVTGQVYSIAAVSGASSYNWTVPTGWAISGGAGTNSITVTSGTTGQNGNISVTASNGCGISSASSLAVAVFDGPAVSTQAITACGSYSWNNNTYTMGGIYTDTLPNAGPCGSIETLILTIIQPSDSLFTVTVCNQYSWNDSVYTSSGIYTDTIPNVSGCDSIMTLNLTILNSTSETITVSACDNYLAPDGQLYNSSGVRTAIIPNASGCDSLITINLTIQTVDTAVTQNGNTLTAGAIGADYQWLSCNVGYIPVSGENTSSFTASQNGTYAVQVTQNNCVDTSACFFVTVLAVDENARQNEMMLYPNPVSHQLVLSSASNVLGQLLVYNQTGALVYSEQLSTRTANLNLSHLPDGIYTVLLPDCHFRRNVIKRN